MSPGPQHDDGKKRESFASGRTGAAAVALFAYVFIAILLTFIDSQGSRALELFNLYSDTPPSIVATILSGAAALGSSDPAARRTWWLLTGALGCYTVGNISHATYWLFDIDPKKKMWDNDNRPYPMKNWSSLMLMNVRRCMEYLTPVYISKASGAQLHQFDWLPDKNMIGTLPIEWIYLIGEYPKRENVKLAHFTLGLPAISGYEQQDYAREWFDEFQAACRVGGV